jgi:hypothetical protein
MASMPPPGRQGCSDISSAAQAAFARVMSCFEETRPRRGVAAVN